MRAMYTVEYGGRSSCEAAGRVLIDWHLMLIPIPVPVLDALPVRCLRPVRYSCSVVSCMVFLFTLLGLVHRCCRVHEWYLCIFCCCIFTVKQAGMAWLQVQNMNGQADMVNVVLFADSGFCSCCTWFLNLLHSQYINLLYIWYIFSFVITTSFIYLL